MANGDGGARNSIGVRIGEAIRGRIAEAIVAGLVLLAGGIWAGIHFWLAGLIEQSVVQGLNDPQDTAIRPAIIKFLRREADDDNSPIHGFTDKIVTKQFLSEAVTAEVNKKIASLIGVSVGEHAELSPERPKVSFPIVVPPNGKAWLLYRVQTANDGVKHLGMAINGIDVSPKAEFHRGPNAINIIRLESVKRWDAENIIRAIAENNGTTIQIAVPSDRRLENSIFDMDLFLTETDRVVLKEDQDASQKKNENISGKDVTIFFTVFGIDDLNVTMVGED